MLFCFLFKNQQAETLVVLSLNEAKTVVSYWRKCQLLFLFFYTWKPKSQFKSKQRRNARAAGRKPAFGTTILLCKEKAGGKTPDLAPSFGLVCCGQGMSTASMLKGWLGLGCHIYHWVNGDILTPVHPSGHRGMSMGKWDTAVILLTWNRASKWWLVCIFISFVSFHVLFPLISFLIPLFPFISLCLPFC